MFNNLYSFLCRVIPSLCYNYLQIIGVEQSNTLAYAQVVGLMSLDGFIAIGGVAVYYARYFPLLIVIIAFFTMFDILGRCLSLCKVKRFVYNSKKDITREVGKQLLESGNYYEIHLI